MGPLLIMTIKSTASNFFYSLKGLVGRFSRAGSSPVVCSNADLVELADTPESLSVLCFFEHMSSLDGKAGCKSSRCRFESCIDI